MTTYSDNVCIHIMLTTTHQWKINRFTYNLENPVVTIGALQHLVPMVLSMSYGHSLFFCGATMPRTLHVDFALLFIPEVHDEAGIDAGHVFFPFSFHHWFHFRSRQKVYAAYNNISHSCQISLPISVAIFLVSFFLSLVSLTQSHKSQSISSFYSVKNVTVLGQPEILLYCYVPAGCGGTRCHAGIQIHCCYSIHHTVGTGPPPQSFLRLFLDDSSCTRFADVIWFQVINKNCIWWDMG